jgi:hypothetical protein
VQGRAVIEAHDIDDIRSRYQAHEEFLDERGRRLLASNEALALGRGGVTAVAKVTGLARSTINRGIKDLQLGNDIASAALVADVNLPSRRNPVCPRHWRR